MPINKYRQLCLNVFKWSPQEFRTATLVDIHYRIQKENFKKPAGSKAPSKKDYEKMKANYDKFLKKKKKNG